MSNDAGYPMTGWNKEEKKTLRGWLLTALHFQNPDVNAWLLIGMLGFFGGGLFWAIDIVRSL